MIRAGVRTRWCVVTASLSLALSLVALLPTAAPVGAQAPTPTPPITFGYTGAEQSWVVPADVHQATFIVAGAQGGDYGFFNSGGLGGQASVTIPVTPGEELTIVVGGPGVAPPSADPGARVGCADAAADDRVPGGFNGGGDGTGNEGCDGPSGGGASDVRRGGSGLDQRVIVAGGGGGVGGTCAVAGTGGGLTGGAADCGGGAGGGQDPGSGSGQPGQGGAGGDAAPGAGGGGGYYGGAGGTVDSGGGGGGSGYGPPDTLFENGVNTGAGSVRILFGDAPTVTGVSPNFGPARGGAGVVITGTNLQSARPDQSFPSLAVYFGATPADPNAVSCTATRCDVTAPAGTDTVNVRVEVAGQSSLDTPADDYTFVGDPTIASISPTSGSMDTTISVDGTNFLTAPFTTDVRFGATISPGTACTSRAQCTTLTPSGLGPVDVTASTPQGSSNGVQFTRLPGVQHLVPTSGRAGGNTAVTITGTDFDMTPGHTVVHFGEAAAVAVGCASTTTCTVVSPPGSGVVAVRVTVDGWESPEVAGVSDFTYNAADIQPSPMVPVDVRFDEDEVAPHTADEPFLQATAAAVRTGSPTATVSVEGHADSGGPDDYNDDLSQRRAQAVTDWLVNTGGVAADRITTVSYGERVPVASNDTPEGRAANRRVTITVSE